MKVLEQYKGEPTEEGCKEIIKTFQTSFQFIQNDFSKLKAMGVPFEFLEEPNENANYNLNIEDILKMGTRVDIKGINAAVMQILELEKYDNDSELNIDKGFLEFYLIYFSGRTRVPIDMLARAFADHLQQNYHDQDKTKEAFEIINAFRPKLHSPYVVDFTNIDDYRNFFLVVFDKIREFYDQFGQTHQIYTERYDAEEIQCLIRTIIQKQDGAAPLKLHLQKHIFFELDSKDEEEEAEVHVYLKGMTLTSLPNQNFWSVGSNVDCDLALVKMNVSFSHTFLIINEGGKYFLVDTSNIEPDYEPCIALAKNKERILPNNAAINIAGDCLYSISSLDVSKISLKFIRCSSDTQDAPEEINQDIVDGQITLGRSGEIQIPVDGVSSKHAIIKVGLITDTSSNGTYLHPRTSIEEERGIQSNPVEFNPVLGEKIYLNGYILALQ